MLNMRAGLVASAIYNCTPGRKGRTVHPLDFFEERDEFESHIEEAQSIEEVSAAFDRFELYLNAAHRIN